MLLEGVAVWQAIEGLSGELLLLYYPLLNDGLLRIFEPLVGVGDFDAMERVRCGFSNRLGCSGG